MTPDAEKLVAAVRQVADNLAIEAFHETACIPQSSDAKASAADAIRALLDVGMPRLLAAAWDEGHRFTGYEPERGENPYQSPVATNPDVGPRCPACRMGLVTHEPKDPRCIIYGTN